jgi:hypothetical protein
MLFYVLVDILECFVNIVDEFQANIEIDRSYALLTTPRVDVCAPALSGSAS